MPLRKIKTIDHPAVEAARNTLVCGCNEQGAYIQFAKDIVLYGLHEALLYAESYEKCGYYTKGTAAKAREAAMKKVN